LESGKGSSKEVFPLLKCSEQKGMPKINFEISLKKVKICVTENEANCTKKENVPAPTLNLSKCYRNELMESDRYDCQKVKEFSVKRCKEMLELVREVGVYTNSDVDDFDRYLESMINPFAESNTKKTEMKKKCEGIKDKSTKHCDALPIEKIVRGEKINCKEECLSALKECRAPSFSCFSDDMLTQYCSGGYRSSTNTFGNDELSPGHPAFNREDSAHLTTSTKLSTYLHEIGHVLNMNDEYENDRYPFLPQGEHDSMMGVSSSNARFYPRHFKRILNPMQCGQEGL
jgi:hypothetical protein